MSHLTEGQLHAYLDGSAEALEGITPEGVRRHVEVCSDCAARLDSARLLHERAHSLLGEAAPDSIEAPPFEELRRRAASAEDRADLREPAGGEPKTAAVGRAASGTGDRRRGAFGGRPEGLAWAATLAVALTAGWLARGMVAPPPITERASEVGVEAPVAVDGAFGDGRGREPAATLDEAPGRTGSENDALGRAVEAEVSQDAAVGESAEADAVAQDAVAVEEVAVDEVEVGGVGGERTRRQEALENRKAGAAPPAVEAPRAEPPPAARPGGALEPGRAEAKGAEQQRANERALLKEADEVEEIAPGGADPGDRPVPEEEANRGLPPDRAAAKAALPGPSGPATEAGPPGWMPIEPEKVDSVVGGRHLTVAGLQLLSVYVRTAGGRPAVWTAQRLPSGHTLDLLQRPLDSATKDELAAGLWADGAAEAEADARTAEPQADDARNAGPAAYESVQRVERDGFLIEARAPLTPDSLRSLLSRLRD